MDKLKRRIKITALLHVAGILTVLLFVLAVYVTKDSPIYRVGDCAFREKVGLYCFGCGGTRAVMALLRGDVFSSFLYYPTLLLTLLMTLYWDSIHIIGYGKKSESILKFAPWQMWLCVPVLILLQWIVRNLLAIYGGFDPLGNLTACINLFLT